MEIVVPAYNVKADQATRHEAQIAAIIHAHRNREINRFHEDKLPPKQGRDAPIVGGPKLPEAEADRTGSAKGRENNATDEIVLKVLKGRPMSIADIATTTSMSRQLVRHIIERLIARKEIVKKNTAFVTLFLAVGETSDG